MGAVASKNDPVMAETFHPAALKCIDRYPFKFKLNGVAKHGFKTWDHIFRLLFGGMIDVPTQLQVNSPDIIGLFVQ